jgi:putative membrane protein
MMGWNYYDGWSFLWMGAVMLLVWGAVIALVAMLVRSQNHRPEGDQALETLRRRFAAGEITQDEFESRRRALQS